MCATAADPADEFLEVWTKQETPILATPPEALGPAADHNGWRDPFIFEFPGKENDMCVLSTLHARRLSRLFIFAVA